MTAARDHGGGIDAAIACFGGTRADWIDLSTGIAELVRAARLIEFQNPFANV